VISVDKY